MTTRIEFIDKLPSFAAVTNTAALITPFVNRERLARPFNLIVAVTRHCNSRCKMCHIWQEKDTPTLSLDQYRTMFRLPFPSVRSLTITGGEPTLRKDLPELFEIIRAACPKVEHAMLATSGLNVQRTLEHVTSILTNVAAAPGKLRLFEVQISLDGIDEMHDQVRGIHGFFTKVERVLAGLAELHQQFPMLRVKLSTVVMPENVGHVQRLRAFATERGLPIHFSPVVLSGTYYSNLETAEMIGFVPGSPASQEAQSFFEQLGEEDASALRYYYRDVRAMMGGTTRSRTCMMGFFSCVVEYSGDVYACVNWEQQSFGNLLNDSFDDIWFGPKAHAARLALRETGCPTCPSMCYTQPINAGELLATKARRVQKRAAAWLAPRPKESSI
ncbi:MAG: radical SAM protein [Herpetosiphonaceae bacterium]|nr:radical SAM protein [Herpetosiphonaceae bacterium]